MASRELKTDSVLLIIGVVLLMSFAASCLFLIAPIRPVLDDQGKIVGTEPSPLFERHKKLQYILVVSGGAFMIAGVFAYVRSRGQHSD